MKLHIPRNLGTFQNDTPVEKRAGSAFQTFRISSMPMANWLDQ